ncbi:PREDICTED: protein BEAN1 [Chrysochloris asiatica]|uniref:Protein BEAN1 n=1 Tax=Chrysochloris asiatica TaxID=185453 RepID=A0A9B0TMX2_CHRAS|nr:PREDICTED: protein BEAN1 [Chrysochloris asiatica]
MGLAPLQQTPQRTYLQPQSGILGTYSPAPSQLSGGMLALDLKVCPKSLQQRGTEQAHWGQDSRTIAQSPYFMNQMSLSRQIPNRVAEVATCSLAIGLIARYNRTNYFYSTFSENLEHSHLLVSPVLVASAVIGVVVTLSCITIVIGSLRRDRQARVQQHRHRHRRHHHHHHHHRWHPHRELEHSFVSQGHTYSRSNHRMHYACSPNEDWPPPLELSSDGDVDATVLRDLYPDSPPGYEECVGPGATQLYVPTDAPPPYSLTNSCPALDGLVDTGSGHSPGQQQQAQQIQNHSGLFTISMDTLPPYEAVCGAGPPLGLLPLPGPGPGPKGSQGSSIPSGASASGPERTV